MKVLGGSRVFSLFSLFNSISRLEDESVSPKGRAISVSQSWPLISRTVLYTIFVLLVCKVGLFRGCFSILSLSDPFDKNVLNGMVILRLECSVVSESSL